MLTKPVLGLDPGNERCFLPIHIYDTATGRPVAMILRPGKTPAGREIRSHVHIFAACPNSMLFFLGQHHQSIAPCVVYEFDFDRKGNKSYQPSFVID